MQTAKASPYGRAHALSGSAIATALLLAAWSRGGGLWAHPVVLKPMGPVHPHNSDVRMAGVNGGYALDLACEGSGFANGTCSPSFCNAIADYKTPGCIFTSTLTPTAATRQQDINKLTCQTCTASTDSRCSSTALTALLSSSAGIYAGASAVFALAAPRSTPPHSHPSPPTPAQLGAPRPTSSS